MKTKSKFAIVDYGVGNLGSLFRAFEYFGASIIITDDFKKIKESDALILPGDGSFKSGIEGLRGRNLTETVLSFAKEGKPILGICLGAQILMSESEEFGKSEGLDLIAGKVVKFPEISEKIPHIGWNRIYKPNGKSWKGTILDSTGKNADVYFVHSYILKPNDNKTIVALTSYGSIEFCSVIMDKNIIGCQFHPEKSGQVGLKIIQNFISSIQ